MISFRSQELPFNGQGDVSVYIGGQECLQASLQLQQDQPQLRIRIPQDVQPRTNQCEGGDNKYYVKSVDVNSYKCLERFWMKVV